jgi:hypothetical protein
MPSSGTWESGFFGTSNSLEAASFFPGRYESLEDVIGEDHGQEEIDFLPVSTPDPAPIMETGLFQQVVDQEVKLTENSWCIPRDDSVLFFYEMLLRRQSTEACDRQHYNSLLQFYKANGHVNAPNKVETSDNFFAQWRNHQNSRNVMPAAYQSKKQVHAASEGFTNTAMIPLEEEKERPWCAKRNYTSAYNDAKWNEIYDHLTTFVLKHKHCNVPFHYKENGIALGNWVARQRTEKRRGTIRKDREFQLGNLNFVWENYKKQKTGARRLQMNDNGDFPLEEHDDHRREWLVQQFDAKWNEMYDTLLTFVLEYKHCDVPFHYKENDIALGPWVARQRVEKRKGTIRQDREEKLAKLNFVWEN